MGDYGDSCKEQREDLPANKDTITEKPLVQKMITVKIGGHKIDWQITLIPPNTDNYYGTGYYLHAAPLKDGQPDEGASIHWDVRYMGTKNIDKLTDRWVKDYYIGQSKTGIRKTVKYYV